MATFVTGLVVAVSAVLALAAYLLPVLIGAARRVPDIGAIAVVNILLGWTFVGWVIALALALRTVMPSGATVQFVQNLPPGGWGGYGGYQPWPEPAQLLPPPDDGSGPAEWDEGS